MGELLFILPLSRVKYLKFASLSLRLPIEGVSDVLRAVIADSIGKCCPSGIQTLHLSGFMLFLVPSIQKSLNLRSETVSSSLTTGRGGIPYSPKPTLFTLPHTLIPSNVTDTVQNQPYEPTILLNLGNVLDAFTSQAIKDRKMGICTKLSRLVLQQCVLADDGILELVDYVVDIVQQRGRFTINLSSMPYPSFVHH